MMREGKRRMEEADIGKYIKAIWSQLRSSREREEVQGRRGVKEEGQEESRFLASGVSLVEMVGWGGRLYAPAPPASARTAYVPCNYVL